jgi:flavin-dependent dehydrogenase
MTYDAIITGARVAGSATARLLALKGYRVLLVDKAAFPSDTISTHYVHCSGIARLHGWGLLDRLRATGCPAIGSARFDFGDFSFTASPPPAEGGVAEAFAPRRTVLDKLLVDAAVEAGCELREEYAVEGLLADNGKVTGIRGRSKSGAVSCDSGRWVIGADGPHSLVAHVVDAPQYDTKPVLSCVYYAYWSGIPWTHTELHIRPRSTFITFPTHHNMNLALMSYPIAEFPRIRLDHQAAYLADLPECIRAGRRETRVFGSADLPNFYRRPFGEGWALVGDAGYDKDPLTAQGISDAFQQAELLAEALDAALRGSQPPAEALAQYEQRRNRVSRAIYEFTAQRASYQPPPPGMMELLRAVSDSPEDAGRFVGIDAGTVRCEDFFHPENVQRILARSR